MPQLYFDLRFCIKFMEGLACIVGFLCWARLYPRFWKAFPFYLLIITCSEFLGWYLTANNIKASKILYQNFVIPLQFLFIHFLYYHNLQQKIRKLVIGLSLLYIVAYVVEYLVIRDSKWMWMSFSYLVGCISILVLSVAWFLQFLKGNRVIEFSREMFFWVNLGLIIFYVGSFPNYATVGFLYKKNGSLANLLLWTPVIFNLIMYSLFITAFLCSRKPRPS